METLHRWNLIVLPMLLLAMPAWSQEGEPGPMEEEQVAEVEELVLVGSRTQARSVTDSPVPVDVIDSEELAGQGITDPMDLLSSTIPSFNSFQPSISGASSFVRPIGFRNLPAESTLVLVNGKRRHRSSVIALITGGSSDGSQGVDIHALPFIALKQVEVLRDGNSAQYGSDAVAGVLNMVLKDDSQGGTVEGRWGQYYEGDGTSYTVAANAGFGIPVQGEEMGFANFSLEYTTSDATVRSVQRADVAAMALAGYNVANPEVKWGLPDVESDIKFVANTGLRLSDNAEAYMFASYNRRDYDASYLFRNPTTTYGQEGIYRRTVPAPYPFVHLIADLRTTPNPLKGLGDEPYPVIGGIDANGDMIPDFPIPAHFAPVHTSHPLNRDPDNPDRPAFATVNEIFPNGFTPRLEVEIDDFSLAGGVRGDLENQWSYDVGAIVGQHTSSFDIRNTFNPQLLAHPDFRSDPASAPTRYHSGKFSELDYTINADISRPFEIGSLSSPLNVATGLEYRVEEFQIHEGEEYSWWFDDSPGGLLDQGFSSGASGSPGFLPEQATTTTRGSYAAYLDLETDLTEALLVGAALRFEDYEDFGSTVNGKLSGRYQLQPWMALRGSINNAFRAPTAGQTGLRNLGSGFDGWPPQLVTTAIIPPSDPVARELGATPLDPETSINYSVGTILTWGDLEVTLDYYNIKIDDRIYLTDYIIPTDDQQRITRSNRIRYFTNAFDTTTEGLDVVASYPIAHSLGKTVLTAAFSWSQTEVDKIHNNPDYPQVDALPAQRIDQLESNMPGYRGVLTMANMLGPWTFTTRLRYYGEFTEYHVDLEGLRWDVGSNLLADLEAQYDFGSGFTLAAGARNILDDYPDEVPASMSRISGAAYPLNSPFGFNGGFYYLRAIYSW